MNVNWRGILIILAVLIGSVAWIYKYNKNLEHYSYIGIENPLVPQPFSEYNVQTVFSQPGDEFQLQNTTGGATHGLQVLDDRLKLNQAYPTEYAVNDGWAINGNTENDLNFTAWPIRAFDTL